MVIPSQTTSCTCKDHVAGDVLSTHESHLSGHPRSSADVSFLISQTTSVGDLFEDAAVRRVDAVIGLTLELPTSPKPSAGFAHISNVSDDRVEKLEKKFRPGQKVRARVVGHWGLEGLATVSLKPSVVEQKLLTYDDVIPGMEVRGTVVSVEDWGARLQLSDSIRAICPLAHMSEVALSKRSPKFQVGFCCPFNFGD